MRMCSCFAYVLVGFAASAPQSTGQTENSYFVLPASAAKDITQQCSRSAPHAKSGWMPGSADIAQAEAHLGEIASLRTGRESVQHPEQSLREYVGIVVHGKRLIYLNALPTYQRDTFLKHQEVKTTASICDGGPAFWGAVYDPATGHFSDLQTNGEA